MKPADVIGVLALPPRLTVRALDDLHAIAMAARDISSALYQLEQRAEAVGRQLDTAVKLIRRIEKTGEQALVLGERFDEVAVSIIAQGSAIEAAARDVAARGAAVADALPPLQRALEIAEPLEGVVERLARVADRLPGGTRRSAR